MINSLGSDSAGYCSRAAFGILLRNLITATVVYSTVQHFESAFADSGRMGQQYKNCLMVFGGSAGRTQHPFGKGTS